MKIVILFSFTLVRKERKAWGDHLERRGRTLVALALYWYFHMIVQHVLDMQALARNEEWENALIFSICFESTKMIGCSVWALRGKKRLHVPHNAFKFFLKGLGPHLHKNVTRMRKTTSIESRIAMLLWRMGQESSFVQFPSLVWFRIRTLHVIPNIIGIIDGSHNLTLAHFKKHLFLAQGKKQRLFKMPNLYPNFFIFISSRLLHTLCSCQCCKFFFHLTAYCNQKFNDIISLFIRDLPSPSESPNSNASFFAFILGVHFNLKIDFPLSLFYLM